MAVNTDGLPTASARFNPKVTGEISLEAAGDGIEALLGGKPTTAQRPPEPDELADPAEDAGSVARVPDEDETEPVRAEAEDEEGTEEPTEPLYRVVNEDGSEEAVTREEAKARTMRLADYTRKTQALAEQRRRTEQETAQVQAERKAYAERMTMLEQALQASAKPQRDWDALKAQDPIGYALEWADHQRAEQQKYAIQQEAARARQVALADTVSTERGKLIEKVPEWQDEKVMAEEWGHIASYMKSRGFSDQELAGVTDHRVIMAIRDAWLGSTAQADKPKVKELVRQKIDRAKAVSPGPAATAKKVVTQEDTWRKQLRSGNLSGEAALRVAGNLIGKKIERGEW